jgi:CBS-domain-containing membrane protein
LLPRVEKLAKGGIVTRQRMTALFRCPVRVRDAMASDVASVGPDTELAEVVELLLARHVKAVPVVDAGRRVLGVVTGGDLLTRGGLSARLSLFGLLPADAREAAAAALSGHTAKEVMTAPAETIGERASLREASERMVKKGLKRLPVVDEAGELIGIVSRTDILRAAAKAPAASAEALPRFTAGLMQQARDVLIADVPTARPDEALADVMARLIASPLRRVVVLDAAGKVVGIVHDGDLLARCGSAKRPGILRALFGNTDDDEEAGVCPTGTAAEAMQTTVYSVAEDAALTDVLQKMIVHGDKRLVVIDDDGKLRGMVDREAVLRAIAGRA